MYAGTIGRLSALTLTADRGGFEGLRYFGPDPASRVEARLHEHDDPEGIAVETTEGGERRYVTVGEFRVARDGADVTL